MGLLCIKTKATTVNIYISINYFYCVKRAPETSKQNGANMCKFLLRRRHHVGLVMVPFMSHDHCYYKLCFSFFVFCIYHSWLIGVLLDLLTSSTDLKFKSICSHLSKAFVGLSKIENREQNHTVVVDESPSSFNAPIHLHNLGFIWHKMWIFPNSLYICNLVFLVWLFCANGESRSRRSPSGKTVQGFFLCQYYYFF